MKNLCLFALGETFDVDAYMADSSNMPSRIWRRGQPKASGEVYPTSGIVFDLDEGEPLLLRHQEDVAMAYIKAHRDELHRLGAFPGVTHFTLALQYLTTAERGLVCFSMGASQWLMWHLLDIGGTLTHYVWLESADLGDNA